MASTVFPAAAGGGIKSVQRGSAGASGNVTITAVDIAKSFVTVFGTASTGNVSVSGGVASTTTTAANNTQGAGPDYIVSTGATIASANLTAGTTTLIAGITQGYLANSTTLTVSGACRYEVVEFA